MHCKVRFLGGVLDDVRIVSFLLCARRWTVVSLIALVPFETFFTKMRNWSVSQFGLGVVVAVAIIASVGMANQVKKKFDIAVVADRCPLRGGSWVLTPEHAKQRTVVAQEIVNAFNDMKKDDFDLKIGVFTHDGTDLHTSSAFDDHLPQVTGLDENNGANANNCGDVKSRFDSFKEEIKTHGGNRQDAPDVIIWMLISQISSSSESSMTEELQKLLKIPDHGIEGFVAIEKDITDANTPVYKAEQVFLTSRSESKHEVLPLNDPARIKDTIKASLSDLFLSCSVVSTTISDCYYDVNSECIKERTVSTSAANTLHKFCGVPIGTFQEPCEDNGDKAKCVSICEDLIKKDSYVVSLCSVQRCGEIGHQVIRPRLDPNSKFKNCPNETVSCETKACVSEGVEVLTLPNGEPITRGRVTFKTTTTTKSVTEAALVTKKSSELETWHIVVISLGGTALICVVAIVIVCIVVSAARKRRAKSRKHIHIHPKGAHFPHRSPNRPQYSPGRPTEMNRGKSNEQSRDHFWKQQTPGIDRPRTGGDRYDRQQSPAGGQDYRHRSPSQRR